MEFLGSVLQYWGNRMSTLDSPFSTGESRVALLVQCNASLGWVDGDAECSHSSYLSYVTHLSLCGPWGCFIHILGSGIFRMVSCLWIVASWSFGDRHWSWDWLMSPSWWHYFKWALWCVVHLKWRLLCSRDEQKFDLELNVRVPKQKADYTLSTHV